MVTWGMTDPGGVWDFLEDPSSSDAAMVGQVVRCLYGNLGDDGPRGSKKVKGKGMVLYSAVSSPLDRSERFTLSSPGRPVHSDTVLGFSWKHSSHAAIAQRLFTHISTTVYSQVLIYTAESTEAS